MTEAVADAVHEALLFSTVPAPLLNIMNTAQQSAVVKMVIQSMPFVIFLGHLVFLQHPPAASVNACPASALFIQFRRPRLRFGLLHWTSKAGHVFGVVCGHVWSCVSMSTQQKNKSIFFDGYRYTHTPPRKKYPYTSYVPPKNHLHHPIPYLHLYGNQRTHKRSCPQIRGKKKASTKTKAAPLLPYIHTIKH